MSGARVRGRAAGNLLALCLGLVLALAAVEAAVRLVEARQGHRPRSDRPLFYYKPRGENGMLDANYADPKPPEVFRIVVLGDSVTFGMHVQYDDAWPKRLERMLNVGAGGPRVEVINLAQPGLSTFQEVADLREALGRGPDLVLLGYFLNDPEAKPRRTTDLVRPADSRFGPKVFKGWEKRLAKHWRTYRLLAGRLHNARAKRAFVSFYQDLYADDNWGWKKAKEAFREMSRLCRNQGVPLAVVIFPVLGLRLDKDHYPFLELHRKVERECREAGLPSFDLFESFRGMSLERLEVVPGADRHLSEIGHRVAAEGVLGFLSEAKLIPPAAAPAKTTDDRIMKEYRPTYRPAE